MGLQRYKVDLLTSSVICFYFFLLHPENSSYVALGRETLVQKKRVDFVKSTFGSSPCG